MFKIREIAVIICVIFLISCKVDPKILPISPSNELKEITPVGFPNANYTFSLNIISENKFIEAELKVSKLMNNIKNAYLLLAGTIKNCAIAKKQ